MQSAEFGVTTVKQLDLALRENASAPNANNLGEVLAALPLLAGHSVALDIGGANFAGKESTVQLADALQTPVHVIAGREDATKRLKRELAGRVKIYPDMSRLGKNRYDVVVISPARKAIMSNLSGIPAKILEYVKPEGYLITSGLLPDRIGLPGYEQPEPEVAKAFTESFTATGADIARLPSWLEDHFELVMNVPRRNGPTCISWLVLRRRAESRSDNTLPGILDRLSLSHTDTLALDVGGAAFSGRESTIFLTEALDRPVHVIAAAKAEATAKMKLKFGERVVVFPNLEAVRGHSYDLIVVSGSLNGVMVNLSGASSKFAHLLKPGGYLVIWGLRPDTLGAPEYEQPPQEVSKAFAEDFATVGSDITRLPAALDEHFEFVTNVPRKRTERSCLSWLVLRRLAESRSSNTLPHVLRSLDLPADEAAVLDIGGAAFAGKQSTVFLADAYSKPIHTVAFTRAEKAARIEQAMGDRVQVFSDWKNVATESYDLVVVDPCATSLLANLVLVGSRYFTFVKPGGFVVTWGYLPDRLGNSEFAQPAAAVASEFAANFGSLGPEIVQLPEWLEDHFEFVMNMPMRNGSADCVSWIVLRRRMTSRASNMLGDILADLPVSRSSGTALDIGGAASLGKESTVFLADAFDAPVHLIAGTRPEFAQKMKGEFEDRLEVFPAVEAVRNHAYDVVVVSTSLRGVMTNLSALSSKYFDLVKPGGFLITFGFQPEKLGNPNYQQPDAEALGQFRSDFGIVDGRITRLPASLDEQFQLVMNVPRKRRGSDCISWLILQRRESSDNTLGDVLAQLPVSPGEGVALDMSGPRSARTRTVGILTQYFDKAVHVVAPKLASSEKLAHDYAGKVELFPDMEALGKNAYDVVVLNPSYKNLMSTIAALPIRYLDMVKPGGYLATWALRPEALGSSAFEQPDVTLSQTFRETFTIEDDAIVGLPDWLNDDFELVMNVPRRRDSFDCSSWLVLRRRVLPASYERYYKYVEQVPLPSAAHYGALLNSLAYPPIPERVTSALREFAPDTVMFVNNPVTNDARVVKTAEAVAGFGRKILCVGVSRATRFELTELSGGIKLLRIPNFIARLKRMDRDLADALRVELNIARLGIYLALLIEEVGEGEIVLHTHDFMGLFAGGIAANLISHFKLNVRRVSWVHDVHEYVRDYGIIDPGIQAAAARWEDHFLGQVDELITVSEELGENLVKAYNLPRMPEIIYNTNELASRYKYKGPSLRSVLGVGDAPILVHSGSVRSGRGVEYVVQALPQLPGLHFLLITGSSNEYLEDVLKQAETLGVRDRVHLHPLLPYDEAASFIAEANIGVIPMDHYGNAEVALPNKFFDYILAGLPVVTADTKSLARVMAEWPVGRVFPAGDVTALTQALSEVVNDPKRFQIAISSRPDLLLQFSWEMQTKKLRDIYLRLNNAGKI